MDMMIKMMMVMLIRVLQLFNDSSLDGKIDDDVDGKGESSEDPDDSC